MQLDNLRSVRPAILAPIFGVILLFSYFFWVVVYNIFFHPLRKYPGPTLWAASRIPLTRALISGGSLDRILELHKQYGDIVRIAPDELSYNHPDAWNEIYGHRKQNEAENSKDPIFYYRNRHNIIGADREAHARLRRILSHGFSARSMLEQEPLIKAYVDQLIRQLHVHSEGGKRPLNIVSWFNFTTFDLIGDLAFGEPFGCLANATYHPWISMIFLSIKGAMLYTLVRYFPLVSGLLTLFVPRSLLKFRAEHLRMTHEKVAKRKELGTYRPDFMESMLRKDGSEKLTDEELDSNASILIVAGSETTATALSGATYLLTTNPVRMAKLVQEIRTTFKDEAEINILSTQQLPYLNAVAEESLRMYPPVPTALPRIAPAEGVTILGQYVPARTFISIWQWPLYNNVKWFAQPDSFVPERWLGDPRFANDRLDVLQPFSTGPRNCIGKNLAYAEMRLILCRTLWNFDVELAEESRNWLGEQKTFILWEKGALNVYLKPRKFE